MRVLLVEDTEALRSLFARVLESHGCVVCKAESAHAALDAITRFGPDLVLTDVMMPEMDGIELILRLRAIPDLTQIPIVAISADSTPETERRAREAGAIDFITKPVDLSRILGRFRDYRNQLPREP